MIEITSEMLYRAVALHATISRDGMRGEWRTPEALAQKAQAAALAMEGYVPIDPAEYGSLLHDYDELRALNATLVAEQARQTAVIVEKDAELARRMTTIETLEDENQELRTTIAALEAEIVKLKKKQK